MDFGLRNQMTPSLPFISRVYLIITRLIKATLKKKLVYKSQIQSKDSVYLLLEGVLCAEFPTPESLKTDT